MDFLNFLNEVPFLYGFIRYTGILSSVSFLVWKLLKYIAKEETQMGVNKIKNLFHKKTIKFLCGSFDSGKIQEYICIRFKNEICLVNAERNSGILLTRLQDTTFSEKYNEHTIYISIDYNHDVLVSSKTADLDILKEYVEYIKKSLDTDKKIKVYVPSIKNKKTINKFNAEKIISWDEFKIKVNKKMDNIILSKRVQESFLDDIKNFVSAETEYCKLGLPYSKGCILYGPPGCGKTSIVKIIAKEYNIPIFQFNLSLIENDHVFLTLIHEMYTLIDGKYIILFEDLDKSNFIHFSEFGKVSFEALLQFIDGIIEPYGRILIITINSTDFQNKIPSSLFRPGRIDKIFKVDYCDEYQMQKIIKLHYGIDTNLKINANITPAMAIKIVRENSFEKTKEIIENFDKTKYANKIVVLD